MNNTEIKTYITKKKTTILYKEVGGLVVEKCCTKCQKWWEIKKFSTSKFAAFGKSNECNSCTAERFTLANRAKGMKPKKPEIIVNTSGIMISRPCTKCKYVKLADEFDLNVSGHYGHDSSCTECKKRQGELYRRNKGIKQKRTIPVLLDDKGNVVGRECCRCHNPFPLKEFNKHGGEKSTAYLRVHPYCKTCSKERHLIQKYGFGHEGKREMYDAQNGACFTCLEKLPVDSLVIDHCHTSGKVRGLLCEGCNKGLGNVKDSVETLKRMIDYLERGKNERGSL